MFVILNLMERGHFFWPLKLHCLLQQMEKKLITADWVDYLPCFGDVTLKF